MYKILVEALYLILMYTSIATLLIICCAAITKIPLRSISPAIPLSKQRRRQNAHRAVGCPCIQQASERPGFHLHRVVKRWREGGREALYLSAIYSRGGSDRGWKSDRGRVGLYKEMAVDIVNSRGREREEWRGDPPCLSLIRRELKVQCLPLSNANWSTCAC